jgi:hypothetical protein
MIPSEKAEVTYGNIRITEPLAADDGYDLNVFVE